VTGIRLPAHRRARNGSAAHRCWQQRSSAGDGNAGYSPSAAAHGELRYPQGYTPAVLVHESRILQVTIFETLQNNLNHLDFSLLLPDVMTIADEVDSQLRSQWIAT
jgi:hypothetical protein